MAEYDGKDIVAFQVGSKITNDIGRVRRAVTSGLRVIPLERRRFIFMQAAGFDGVWSELAKAPSLGKMEVGDNG